MFKLIVFDWDGTLVDSVPTIIRCKRFLAKKYNVPAPSDQQVHDVLGLNFAVAMQRSFPDLDENQLKEIGEEYHALMQHPDYHSKLFSDVRPMLQTLKEKNLKLAIATSKVRGEFSSEMDEAGIAKMFDLIVCGGEHGDKPDPEKLEYIMQYFNLNRDQTLMVGDTKTDMQFAHNAGVSAVGVTFGAHHRNILQQENPAWIVDSWADLMALL